jgi:hypothetical protein
MALVLQRIKERVPNTHIVYRFIGITPDSGGARKLTHSVYDQVCLSISLFFYFFLFPLI